MVPRREKHKKSKRMRRENSGPRGDPCAPPDHQSCGYTWEHGSPMSAIAKKHTIEGVTWWEKEALVHATLNRPRLWEPVLIPN